MALLRDAVSHWNRTPHPIAIRTLLSRIGKNFILDHTVSHGLARYLPAGARHLSEFDDGKAFSRNAVVGICQGKNGILVTADVEYASLVGTDSKSSWGVILLPSEDAAQVEILCRISEGKLMFRPSAERTGMFEYVRRNRLLLDFRQSPPIVSVHSDCYWSGGSK